MSRYGGGDIYHLDVSYLTLACARNQNGDTLSGMVGALPCRIIAVISCEDEQIVLAQCSQNMAELSVKPCEVGGVAFGIAPMAEFGIKLHEIGKRQGAFRGCVDAVMEVLHQLRVAALCGGVDAAVREDIADFADGVGVVPLCLRPVQQRGRGRGDGVVMAVLCPLKAAVGADEGAGDNAAHLEGMEMWREVFTELEKARQAEVVFMRGDLEDRICRGVTDRPACLDVLLGEAINDLCARGVAVAEGSFCACKLGDQCEQIRGEGWGCVREIVPRPRDGHARKLPMA